MDADGIPGVHSTGSVLEGVKERPTCTDVLSFVWRFQKKDMASLQDKALPFRYEEISGWRCVSVIMLLGIAR